MSAVALVNVSHRFGGSWVLKNLGLQLPRGARVLLTGGNGAGKTTLLRLVATALRPSHGQLRLFGLDARLHAAGLRRRLTLMTHRHHFYAALSGDDNLRLVARLAGYGAREAELAAARARDRVKLAGAGATAVAAYSAGMVRRLALARVLLLRPALALFDEPFGQLDAEGTALVEEVLAELGSFGATFVMSSHDVARARPLCDLQVHLDAGGASLRSASAGAPLPGSAAPTAEGDPP